MLNSVTLVGRLTKDADLRYTVKGTAVATFTLAVNRNFTNAQGQREADFIQCVIWGKAAESLAKYTRKGSLIGITGRVQTRSYENKQGQRVYITEVFVLTFTLLESKAVNEQRQVGTQSTHAPVETPSDLYTGGIEIHDDDLPF
ncbi:single-stranded DNA-binding protein [Enterococcus sp. 5B3_DIV0040]|uniref:single-stranded DNA-binding protein n=1 Tax=Enterococcus sp. 5B3_DIV0040 TaxID=1834182 RepID=UPI000A333CD5|nr:single-stranded DNA-binding protein [Enterococcus sp. 5B3_DIV0040]OTO02262.1 hypothetical protein A5883_003089 [Enterococcus sp. 5B3_DIV0040]